MSHQRSIREKVGSKTVESFFEGLSFASKMTPRARRELNALFIERDIKYGPMADHTLDIYHPVKPPKGIVVYVHGGGFRILSKDTHWIMGLGFARRGYRVYNLNYRLAPKHPYPSALEDLALGLEWIRARDSKLGKLPLVFAGESAGANLASATTIAACKRFSEPFAEEIFELGVRPDAVLANCGVLQVSDWPRFARRKNISKFVEERLKEVSLAYLPDDRPGTLADPLLILEQERAWDRPLPPFFSSVGTKDPLLDDTRRLDRALRDLGVYSDSRIYPGEVHAFHAFIWREQALRCWTDQFAFLDRALHLE